jgi:hypothetical protein
MAMLSGVDAETIALSGRRARERWWHRFALRSQRALRFLLFSPIDHPGVIRT